jgi:Domain of Unknown Function (DUF1206)
MPGPDRDDSAFAWMARAGYVARGIVFALVGIFAGLAALDGGRAEGAPGALHRILAQPLGDVMLWIMAAGLICFAGWRFIQALFDADRCGADAAGLWRRAIFAGSGIFYLGMAALAVSIIFGVRGDDDKAARDSTAWLLAEPLGRWVAMAIGIAVAAAGLFQVVKPARADFRRQLSQRSGPRAWMIAVAWIGYLARAVIFVMIGVFLVTAAFHVNSGEAAGLSGALQALQQQTYGRFLLGAAALGLFAFGVFQFMQAAWRRMDVPKVKEVVAKAA